MAPSAIQPIVNTRGIFADWGLPSGDWLDILNELRATDVVLGINRDATPFELSMSEQAIEDAVLAAANVGLQVHLMIWLLPDRSFIRASADVTTRLIQANPQVSSVLFDVERSWIHASPAPDEDTAMFVMDQYAEIGVDLGVTSYALLPPNVRPLVAQVNYGIPQAYALYSPEAAPRGIPTPQLQRDAYASWSSTNGDVRMGLAAYEQTGPGGTFETMRAAIDAILACDLDSVFYWSLRASDAQSRRFIASLAADAEPALA